MAHAFTEEQIMLCLSGLAYRDVHDPLPDRLLLWKVEASIERGLHTLPPLRNGWELAWGPARYRGPLSLFDDKLVYVVRDLGNPRRYVIAIRGTNPISLWDWLFGDLWTARQIPWRYGDGDARVSLSAALSLSIVQGLRSERPRHDGFGKLWALCDERIAGTRAAFDPLTRALARLSRVGPLGELRALSSQLVSRVVRGPAMGRVAGGPQARIVDALALWTSHARKLVFEVIDQASALVGGHVDLALLGLIEDHVSLRATFGSGVTLPGFLAAAALAQDSPLEIIVTGHSKGGALASTVALWLAETQGKDAPEAERWDPERRATVRCFSYAGPTAGNAAFARRSDAIIGPRCLRVWNTLDVVPHAWTAAGLAQIPGLYAPAIERVPALAELVEVIRARTAALDYAQPARAREFRGRAAGPAPANYFDQVVYQHTDGYLVELGLAEHGISFATFVSP